MNSESNIAGYILIWKGSHIMTGRVSFTRPNNKNKSKDKVAGWWREIVPNVLQSAKSIPDTITNWPHARPHCRFEYFIHQSSWRRKNTAVQKNKTNLEMIVVGSLVVGRVSYRDWVEIPAGSIGETRVVVTTYSLLSSLDHFAIYTLQRNCNRVQVHSFRFSQSLGSHPACHARLADPRPKLWCAPWEYRKKRGPASNVCVYAADG